MLTLADRCTLARLVIAPIIALAYVLLPTEPVIVFWVVGLLCGLAEITDFLDGRIARARCEVSDFGKLADPFCDVFYRLTVFMVYLLPVGGVGYALAEPTNWWWQPLSFAVADGAGGTQLVAGTVPFIPVLLMTLREIIAGALRSMAATKGLVLAARTSGKVKAWLQGVTVISLVGWPAVTVGQAEWQLTFAIVATWICALVSVASIVEYIWVNRDVLGQLAMRKKLEPTEEQ
mgnify:CR=1 FL=1